MIQSKEDLEFFLKEDLKRYNNLKPNLKDWLLSNESWYIFHYVYFLRHVEYYSNTKKNKLFFLYYFFRYKRLGFKLRIHIYPNTVGPGLMIFHVGGCIRIKKNAKIGNNCTLLPGVVFGNKGIGEENASVYVGNNCYFGLGAKVFGNVTLGDNVIVGANAIVTKDFSNNVVIGGIPAKVIRTTNN